MTEFQINYITKRGAHMSKFFHNTQDVINEIMRLWKRRTDARAVLNGDEIGAVWKMDKKWCWYYDGDILNSPVGLRKSK